MADQDPMKYVLAVLTHGDNAEKLQGLIYSLHSLVLPRPTACLVVQDGPCALPPKTWLEWHCLTLPEQRGFCDASGAMWDAAIELAEESGSTHVFWLEHDFRFVLPVDIDEIALALDDNTHLAQMQLMRNPVNEEEELAGGVRGKHESRGDVFSDRERWVEHHGWFTTNPNLMRIGFMKANPWPTDGDPYCEGRFGIKLVEQGYCFGIWGDGREEYVRHVGLRDGTGYGY